MIYPRFAVCGLALMSFAFAGDRPGVDPTPVLVELFTSEGCSSCPPADSLLEKLNRDAGVEGVIAIVLSEHVDYWNRLGWADPFSSPLFSARQQAYAARFRLDTVYTPQMVIDGEHQIVGSEAGLARRAMVKAGKSKKLEIDLEASAAAGLFQVAVEVAAAPKGAEVMLALVQSEARIDVRRGENSGRRLRHVNIVRNLGKLGDAGPQGFRQRYETRLEGDEVLSSDRVVVFVQERGQGRVLGVAMATVAQGGPEAPR